MPNPQLHIAVGMIGVLVIIGVLIFLLKIFKKDERIKMMLIVFLPLILLLGAFISIIPDIPVLTSYYPSVSNPIGIDFDKSVWHTPMFNICFFHPYLDAKYLGQYDTIGLILTLIVFNAISLIYFLRIKKDSL